MSDWTFGDQYLSLYVRVLNGFYTHRKTLRLRAVIGDAAFWVPPRLWAYAAENQPDGCFKDYSAEELAMLIGYTGNAQALLEAMLQAGFLDRDTMQVHDWQEHNAYHSVFSQRARKAANAKWGKTPPTPPGKDIEKKVPDQKGKEPSIASSMLQASDVDKRIKEIHLWYSETRGGEIRLDEFSKRLWLEFFKAGHTEDDFKRVFKSKNAMVITGDHPAALHLKNLLAPDRFPDFLADAKNGAVKQPRSGASAPKDSQFIRDLEREVRQTK